MQDSEGLTSVDAHRPHPQRGFRYIACHPTVPINVHSLTLAQRLLSPLDRVDALTQSLSGPRDHFN